LRPSDAIAEGVSKAAQSCDLLAGDPDDIERRSSVGLVAETIESTSVAITVCKKEIDTIEKYNQGILPRLHDQIGRAFEAKGDHQEMLKHYEISAKGGYPSGMARYALLIVGHSPEEAVEYFKKASRRSIIATYKMADFSWSGFSGGLVQKDRSQSMILIKMVVDQGYAEAADHPAYKHFLSTGGNNIATSR